MCQAQQQEFPADCQNAEYKNRLKAAYPIHPEVFDRLYNDWSTLLKFQRTRGVLRLMAAVIHTLWEKGDRSPLIMPASIPISDTRVQSELTRYLSDNWVPVIEKDVDGPNSLPLRLDNEIPNLGKYSACRRVSRTIYLGSAPTTAAAHKGLEDRRIKLGCVLPGEPTAIFGDALRRLSSTATYLYQDGTRYWYSTQPTVTQMASERAEELKRSPEKFAAEVEKRLRAERNTGDFSRVHALPQSGEDVPDDRDARLVIMGTDYTYSKDTENTAVAAARAILESRGNAQRYFRNTLVFLAADKTRLDELDEAVRRYLAWDYILSKSEELNLTAQQSKQAQEQKQAADSVINARIPETYQWLLVPVQSDPQAAVEWKAIRLTGQEPLAVRASKKLRNEELLITGLAGTRLRMELDRIPLWRGNHVNVKQVADDFAQYTYLPRLKNTEVLLGSVGDGLRLMLWQQDSFAYADSFDDTANRYRGLRCGEIFQINDSHLSGLVVKSDVAAKQRESEKKAELPSTGVGTDKKGQSSVPVGSEHEKVKVSSPKRFYGSVKLDSTRAGRDASRIAEEVLAHLVALPGSDVKVTLEIEAHIPQGVPENVVRTVTENSRTLKFENQGFEKE